MDAAFKEFFEEREKKFKLFRTEESKKVFQTVFDRQSYNAIEALSRKGLFNCIEFIISTGKEAHVFRAVDREGNYRAVKIYKIEASDFRAMSDYLEGDERFRKVKKDKRNIVYAWTRKEHHNLLLGEKADAPMPRAIGFKDNVLVMDFIGSKGVPASTLKDTLVEEKYLDGLYEKIIDGYARMFFLSDLIHADFSEYNILLDGLDPVFIDVGQGVLRSHANARVFLERDLKNIARYFSKAGLEKSYERVYNDLKEKRFYEEEKEEKEGEKREGKEKRKVKGKEGEKDARVS